MIIFAQFCASVGLTSLAITQVGFHFGYTQSKLLICGVNRVGLRFHDTSNRGIGIHSGHDQQLV
jgi:hypothetical protein